MPAEVTDPDQENGSGARTAITCRLQPSFGRRHGRRLRESRKRLLASLLPSLAIPPQPAGAVVEPQSLFAAPIRDVWLEIGFGAGEHLAGQALAHPDIGFIGCEPFINGVAALLAQVETLGLANVRVFADDARLLLPHLPAATVERVFVLFADPWPKPRHAGRRLLSAMTLDALARILRPGGTLLIASDHAAYVRWVLWQTLRHPAFTWEAVRAGDWRQPPCDWIETRYEAKAKAAGAVCSYLRFTRTPAAIGP